MITLVDLGITPNFPLVLPLAPLYPKSLNKGRWNCCLQAMVWSRKMVVEEWWIAGRFFVIKQEVGHFRQNMDSEIQCKYQFVYLQSDYTVIFCLRCKKVPCYYALNNVFLAWNLVLYTLASGGKWNSLWQGIRRAAVAEMLMHFQLLHRRIFYATTYIHARSSVRFSGILCKNSKNVNSIHEKPL